MRGRPATGFPVLMVLDEFAGLKRMEVIEHAVAQIAGYGVKLFFVLQSLEQLKAVYKDNWETFLSNSGLRIFFSLDDHFSREYVSKLVGETEVIREVRSASESESESESVSHSTGSSVTRGRSVSEGTNRSGSDSESTGTNSSISRTKGRSFGSSWSPAGLFGLGEKNKQYNRGRNRSTSHTEGTSRGWSHSDTEGSSRGTSDSYGSSTSETEGTTHGTSRSRTMGSSETIQKRALVTPDEIGHLFARISDFDRIGYPGLALVMISGERAIALRRVNYFEDYEFARRFEPHPDYPALPDWKDLSVSILGLAPYTDFLVAAGAKREVRGRVVDVGQIVSGGEPVVSLQVQDSIVNIRSPYAGMITKVGGKDSKGEVTLFFSLRYLETPEPEIYPFTELLSFVRQLTERVRSQAAGATRSIWIIGAVGVLSVIALIATQYLGLLAFIGIMGVLIARKAVEIGRCNRILAACPQRLLDGPGAGNSQDPLGFRAWKLLEELPALEAAQAALPPAPSAPADVPAVSSPAAQENAGAGQAESQPPPEDSPVSGETDRENAVPVGLPESSAPEEPVVGAAADGQMAGVALTVCSLPSAALESVSVPASDAHKSRGKKLWLALSIPVVLVVAAAGLYVATRPPALVPGAYSCQVASIVHDCNVSGGGSGELLLEETPYTAILPLFGTLQVKGGDVMFDGEPGTSLCASHTLPGPTARIGQIVPSSGHVIVVDAMEACHSDRDRAQLKYANGRWSGALVYNGYLTKYEKLPDGRSRVAGFEKKPAGLDFTITPKE